jgi:SH3-like domain-containing protein
MMENILRIVAPGYPFRVIDQQGDWSLVEDFKNRKGWVASNIIIEYNTVILKSDKVNLLSGPGYHNDIVANIDYGTVMQVEKKQDRWLKVYKRDGMVGWIHEDMVWP